MLEFSRLSATRVVSTEEILDSVLTSDEKTLRLAPDEALLLGVSGQEVLDADSHAIVISEGSFFAVEFKPHLALDLMQQHCEWEPPNRQDWPCFCQGAMAGIPVKIHFSEDAVRLCVQSVYLHELQERLSHGVSA